MVHSHLSYGVTIWGSTYKSYFLQIISLQNKAVKIPSNTSWNKNPNLCYKEQKIICLNNLITFETSKSIFLFINNFLPLSFNKYFVLVYSVHNKATSFSGFLANFSPHCILYCKQYQPCFLDQFHLCYIVQSNPVMIWVELDILQKLLETWDIHLDKYYQMHQNHLNKNKQQ